MIYRVLTPLNLCLVGIVCLLGLKVYGVWHDQQSPVSISVDEKMTKPPTFGSKDGIQPKRSKEAYDIIVTKNLFSPSRTEIETGDSLHSQSGIILCGTFIWGANKTALLEMSDLKGQDLLKEIKVGDTVAGYRVADILDDRVILESEEGGRSRVLQLQRQKEKRKHIRTSISKRSGKVSRVVKGTTERKVPAKRISRSRTPRPPTSTSSR